MATEVEGGPGGSLQAYLRMLWPQTAVCLRPGVEGERRSNLTMPKQNKNTQLSGATAPPSDRAENCNTVHFSHKWFLYPVFK